MIDKTNNWIMDMNEQNKGYQKTVPDLTAG